MATAAAHGGKEPWRMKAATLITTLSGLILIIQQIEASGQYLGRLALLAIALVFVGTIVLIIESKSKIIRSIFLIIYVIAGFAVINIVVNRYNYWEDIELGCKYGLDYLGIVDCHAAKGHRVAFYFEPLQISDFAAESPDGSTSQICAKRTIPGAMAVSFLLTRPEKAAPTPWVVSYRTQLPENDYAWLEDFVSTTKGDMAFQGWPAHSPGRDQLVLKSKTEVVKIITCVKPKKDWRDLPDLGNDIDFLAITVRQYGYKDLP